LKIGISRVSVCIASLKRSLNRLVSIMVDAVGGAPSGSFAAIATAHPAMGTGFGPMIRTFPQAIEEQLGLKLVPSDASRDVLVIATAARALQLKVASVEQQLAESPKAQEEQP